MDEAENCDRIAIIDHGQIVALDTPDNLKNAVSGDRISLKAEDNELAERVLREQYNLSPRLESGDPNDYCSGQIFPLSQPKCRCDAGGTGTDVAPC